ncbi:hypothetical protein HMPREF9946_00104 [Acetobacteraceae bacterium AT-5844]|nr:hypothetical protein HMPREF9946_00104 [Acetobacteraceae bacterium AT-5844]
MSETLPLATEEGAILYLPQGAVARAQYIDKLPPVDPGDDAILPVVQGGVAYNASVSGLRQRVRAEVQDDIEQLSQRIASLEYIPPAITAIRLSPAVVERGDTVPSVTVTVERNRLDLPADISGAATAQIPAGETSVAIPGLWAADAGFIATVRDPAAPTGHPDTATAQANLSFRWRRFSGVLNTHTPTDADILALSSEFATASSGRKSATLSPSGQYVVYAQPADWPIAASVTVGAVTSTAFTDTMRMLVNASGAAVPYRIRVLTYPITVSEEFIF